jgi:para-aminobenzoate synthetase component 1
LDHVHALKRHIQRGDIYEINYCIRFFAENTVLDPISIFLKLHALSKAPYSALVKLGDDFILSASPELFLKKEGNHISTKPIKGTIRRGTTIAEDEALKTALHENTKERTENVMAVDVARNDLSQFATKASVHVNKLYNIETFETVHQMVSTVSCEMKEGTSFEAMMNAAFPMASMTGAPKLSAMQLIDTHEDFDRGYYSGAMGLVDGNGDFTLSVIIRSIFYNQHRQQVSLAVGSAITYLSEPEQEYEECLLKANALVKALGAVLH